MKRTGLRKRIRGVWPAAVLALAWSLPLAASPAKDYHFPSVRTSIVIEPDGAFVVDEERAFDFRGRFSAAWIDIPVSDERRGARYEVAIEDFAVRDRDGTALPAEITVSGGTFRGEWTFSAENEVRTFRLHYRVRGASGATRMSRSFTGRSSATAGTVPRTRRP